MFLNIILLFIFFASASALWYRVSVRLSILNAIPEEEITVRIHASSTKFHLFILHFQSFYKEKFFIDFVRNFSAKILYKIHIFFLRIDNGVVAILRKVRNGNAATNGEIARDGADVRLRQEGIVVLSAVDQLDLRRASHKQPVLERRSESDAVRDQERKIQEYFRKPNRITEVRTPITISAAHVAPRTMSVETSLIKIAPVIRSQMKPVTSTRRRPRKKAVQKKNMSSEKERNSQFPMA